MRRIGLCVVAAAIFCTLVLPVLAFWNDNGAWSENGNAYAYVKGWWNTVDHYYKEYHKGEVKDAGDEAITQFRGWLLPSIEYWEEFNLTDNQGTYKTYYERTDLIQTYTDSDTGAGDDILISLRPGIE